MRALWKTGKIIFLLALFRAPRSYQQSYMESGNLPIASASRRSHKGANPRFGSGILVGDDSAHRHGRVLRGDRTT